MNKEFDRCPRCKALDISEDEESKPKCAFPCGVFVSGNWRCATVEALLDLCLAGEGWLHVNCNGQQHATLLAGVDEVHHVLLTWYKRRPILEGAWMIYDGCEPPSTLTLGMAEAILKRGTVDVDSD